MIWNRLEKYRDAGLLILRAGLGLGFAYYHGWAKLSGGPETWRSVGRSMSNLGIDFWPVFWGFMMSVTESVGAVLIAVGFFFRPLCLMPAFGLFIAWLGHTVTGNGTPGHAFKNLFVLLGAMIIGPGKYSVDAWLESRRATRGRTPLR